MTIPQGIKRVICLFLAACFFFQNTLTCYGQALIPTLTPQALNFNPPTLKYLSVNSANPYNYFNFLLDKGSKPALANSGAALEQEAGKLIHYFFIGLTLPESSLWVNLRPDEPGRITSLELAQTDMGKLLLEQDLRLKKDVAQYLNPSQPIGKRFWEELYTQAELLLGKGKLKKTAITTSNRVWIVPDEAVVMETEDGALVTQAKLKVLLESEYLSLKSKSWNKEVEVQIQNKDQLKNLTEALMKSIVIPEISKEVNSGQSYAPLRQIYHSLILAQWFKQKYRKQKENSKDIPYIEAIDQSWLKGLESEFPWSKDAIWKEYLASFQKGEYQLKEKLAGLNRMYTSGGIEFFRGQGSSPLQIIAYNGNGASSPLAKLPDGRENTALAVTRVPFGNKDSTGDATAKWLPDIMAIDPDGTEGRSPSDGLSAKTNEGSEGNEKKIASASSSLVEKGKKESSIRSFLKKIGKSFFSGYGGGDELTFREYFNSVHALSVGELIAMQVSLNEPMTLSTRFSRELSSRLNKSVEYWNHNISNFISRQFAEHERGIVELISNALDASSQGANVSLRPGEIMVANGDKGISLEDVFTSLLIPTLSTKRNRGMSGEAVDEAIKDDKIGRFGVGFLSSFNYLENPDDTMEIISFNQGKGFRIRMGVERQGDGRNARKVVILKSIEEDISLSQEKAKEFFPNISSPKDGGTSVRIKSRSIYEIDSIDKEIVERFTYWTGEPVVVTKTDESGRQEKKYIGLRKDKYMVVHQGADDRAGRQFQLIALLNDGDLSGTEPAYAAHPGEGRFVITLQGVVLATINIPGSNVLSELEVNLPSSAKIPTSRDKVIIDKNTIDAIFSSARGVLNNRGLDANTKIAILNSLYYLLEWVWTTNPSLRSERTLQEFVDAAIGSEQEKLINSSETVLFMPDTLQTREFFDGTKNIILVNPNLLPKIKYAGREPQELDAGEYPAAAKAKGFKIFVVPTKGERPALRLGNTVFLKDDESGQAGRGDIIWQYIVIATIINYWEYMMRQLSFEDARFASAGSYSGIDETEAKKEKVIAYLRSKTEELEKDIASGKEELGTALASYRRILSLLEGKTNLAQGLFYIFKDEIARYANGRSLILEAAEVVTNDFSASLGKHLFVNFYGEKLFEEFKFYYKKMDEEIIGRPFVETAQKGTYKAPDLVEIVVNLISPSGDPRKVELPQDLNYREKELVFMVEIINQWLESGDEPVAKFFEELVASPESRQVWESLRQAITGYYRNFSALSEIEEKHIKNLLDFLTLIYIKRYANTENKGLLPKAIPLNHRSRLVAKGALADIAASFYAAGDDVGIDNIRENIRKIGLRFRAAIGQIQQSINYQDPEEFVFIRELLQNAIDAIRKAEENGNTDSGIRRIDMITRPVNDEDGVKVEFVLRDSVGMDMEEVINYLLIANRSSKKEEFLTGFFGHGFFTALRESEEVWIKTSTGKGKVVIVRLIPNLDSEEGVITGVDYELYEEYSDALPGTEIVWRKRGRVSSVDEILLRAKAEMFSRTLEGNFKLFLNEKEIDRLDRNSSLLTEFVAVNGARVKVYLDEGRASLTVQKGLFVTRLDRRFISDVLNISVGSDLFNLLARLADLGVVLEIPTEVNLTRDRAHFIRRDLTLEIKGAVMGALFDAAIKGMLSGKIALPYKFDYDFITRMLPERLIDPGRREREAYFSVELPKSNELSQLIDFLQHPNAMLLNVVKNWMIGNTNLQDFLGKISYVVNTENGRLREAILGFVKSPEFAAFVEAVKNNSLDDKQLEIVISLFEDRVIGAFSEKRFSSKRKAEMKNFFLRLQDSSEAKARIIWYLVIEFEKVMENLYRSYVKDQIAQEVQQLAYIQKVRGLTYIMRINKLEELNMGAELASQGSIPAIGDDITSFLFDRFIESNPLYMDEVWFMVREAAGKEEDETGSSFEETMKDLSARPDPPLRRSVSIKQIEYHKLSLPYLYYFLKATQVLVDSLKQSSQRILGEELYPGSIGVGVYYDPSDMATLARGGSGIITWHLVEATFQHMRNLLDYLQEPNDGKFDAFLSSMIEVLTHEMTHEEEGRQRTGGRGGTHNKSFFDKQIRLLGVALKDQELHQSIKNELLRLSGDYLSNSDSEELKNSINEFLKPGVENIAVIDKINNILSGHVQKDVFSPDALSLKNRGGSASSPLEQGRQAVKSSLNLARQGDPHAIRELLGRVNAMANSQDKREMEIARQFIREAGKEIGEGLKVFINTYPAHPFVNKIVLGGGVGENLGKGIVGEAGVDILIEAIQGAIGRDDIRIDRSFMSDETRAFLAFLPASEGEFAIALDIGGTNVRTALLDKNGVLGDVKRLMWELKDNPDDNRKYVLDTLTEHIKNAIEEGNLGEADEAIEIGISWAGPGDYDRGIVTGPNIPGFVDFDIKGDLEERLGNIYKKSVRARIVHDGAAGAIGEYKKGALREQAGIYLILGTGIGAGIVDGQDNPIYAVAGEIERNLGEIGHQLVYNKGGGYSYRPGKDGSFPQLAQGEKSFEMRLSGPALAVRFGERLLETLFRESGASSPLEQGDRDDSSGTDESRQALEKLTELLYIEKNKDKKLDIGVIRRILFEAIPESLKLDIITEADRKAGHVFKRIIHCIVALVFFEGLPKNILNIGDGEGIKGLIGEIKSELTEKDLYLLRLAILLHDIGKRPEKKPLEPSHEEHGAADVLPRILGRIKDLSEEDKKTISYLVAHHSALDNFNRSVEINDPEFIVVAADVLGKDLKLVKMLYLLNVVDSIAVNPKKYKNSSRRLLDMTLAFIEIREAIEGVKIESKEKEVEEWYFNQILPDMDKETKKQFLELVGLPFIAGAGSERIEDHLLLFKSVLKKEKNEVGEEKIEFGVVLSDIARLDREKYKELVVAVSQDKQPGLLSAIAEVLANLGYDIHRARIDTVDIDGKKIVFDRFLIKRNPTKSDNVKNAKEDDKKQDNELKEAINNKIKDFLKSNETKKDNAVKEEESHKITNAELEISFPEMDNAEFTKMIIKAKYDSPGLLSDIMKVIFGLGINVSKAEIETWGRNVKDTFYVQENGKPLSKKSKDKLRMALEGLTASSPVEQGDKADIRKFEDEIAKILSEQIGKLREAKNWSENEASVLIKKMNLEGDYAPRHIEKIINEARLVSSGKPKNLLIEYISEFLKNPEVGEERAAGILNYLSQLIHEKGELASSPVAGSADKDAVGGIDLSQIEVTLKDEKFVSLLNPADIKVLHAAKYLKEGWSSLSLLYVHEIMLLLKDNLANDIKQKGLLQEVLKQLQVKGFIVPEIKLALAG